MKEYHKIQTVFHRDPERRFKTLIEGEYSIPEFEFLKGNPWVYTEKVDGTNIRVIFNGVGNGEIRFGGKTKNAQVPVPLMNYLNETFLPQKDQFKEVFGEGDVCLYGEGYGSRIQKIGSKYGANQKFVLFDVKIGEFWLERHNVKDIGEKLGIDVVPIIGKGTIDEMVDFVREGFDSQWGEFIAEGVVARPEVELKTRNGQRIITKLKHVDFPKV